MQDISTTDYVYSITALADFGTGNHTCFAACTSGLKKSDDSGVTWHAAYSKLGSQNRLATMAVVAPDDFHLRRFVVAGLSGGFLRSKDGGTHWEGNLLPNPPPTVSAMVISPDFENDGILFAATLEDGIFCSTNQGQSWEPRNFGLLDPNVLSLAISPAFAEDETIIAGTDSGIFRSSNGGRAWREAHLHCGFAATLALTFSYNYSSDCLIYAGTESSGLLQSEDTGISWKNIAADTCNGAVTAICTTGKGLLVLHNGQVLLSKDNRAFSQWKSNILKNIEVTALFAAHDLKIVLAGCIGGLLLKLN